MQISHAELPVHADRAQVVDERTLNRHFWILYAAVTDVALDLVVRDRVESTQSYRNEQDV